MPEVVWELEVTLQTKPVSAKLDIREINTGSHKLHITSRATFRFVSDIQ
jgi:hypothetical protein